MPSDRVGTATVHRDRGGAVHALFTPDDQPIVSVRPTERAHAARAAAWALRVLGHGHTGGRLVLIADPASGARAESLDVLAADDAVTDGLRVIADSAAGVRAESLAAVLAVDDAVTGGLTPLLRDPALLRGITAAAGISLP